MRTLIKSIVLALSSIRLIPHVLILLAFDRRHYIKADTERWARMYFGTKPAAKKTLRAFVRLMTFYPEFRNLFYYRTGWMGKLLIPICHPISTLFIHTNSIGPGLFIQHGFATIIAANKIGSNCWINQQVTIGFSNSTDCPTLGDNVMVYAGAKIIGGVTIGDNSIIGANAVVIKNVPPNVTVVGVPAYIVKRNGRRVTEAL
jgi:serine O-acetyltransferase